MCAKKFNLCLVSELSFSTEVNRQRVTDVYCCCVSSSFLMLLLRFPILLCSVLFLFWFGLVLPPVDKLISAKIFKSHVQAQKTVQQCSEKNLAARYADDQICVTRTVRIS